MSLNPKTLQFLINQLGKSNYSSFKGVISQIFSYLHAEVKDNPIFEKYEAEKEQWSNWDRDSMYGSDWTLPGTLQESKSLSYWIYNKAASERPNWIDSFAFALFRHSNFEQNVRELNDTFLEYFTEALNDIINANPERDYETPEPAKGNIAFIIHGHDDALKSDVLLLLKRAGVNSFVLHEQPDKGRTIIDKLIEETNNAGYGIALLTPDDLSQDGNSRARQNVILEIGYFLGKLGKSRLRMIVKGDVEIPSDLQGILYEKHDQAGAWRIKLLKEMQAVGIYVDLQSVIASF